MSRASFVHPARLVALVLIFHLGFATTAIRADYSQVGGTGTLVFDGIDDYVTLGDHPSLRLSGDLTVSAWVKPDEGTAGLYMGILGKMRVQSAYKGFCLARDNHNCFRFWIGTGNILYACSSEDAYAESEWHHVAGVMEDGYMLVYVDGVGHRGSKDGVEVAESGVGACVGQECIQEDYEFFDGCIDEVCFYDRALSAGEIQHALSARASISDPCLVGYWDFDETGGQIVWNYGESGDFGYLGWSPGADPADPERTSSSNCQDNRFKPWSYFLTFNTPDDMRDITTNNGEHDFGGLLPVERVTDLWPDTDGMLRLQTLADQGATSPTEKHVIPATATLTLDEDIEVGAFGLKVTFHYVFQSQGGVLRVRRRSQTGETYAASVMAPEPGSEGRSGIVAWSSYESLILTINDPDRRVGELILELRGPLGTSVLINNLRIESWIPSPPPPIEQHPEPIKLSVIVDQVQCTSHCADIAGEDYLVDSKDYLAAAYCCPASIGDNWCVDTEFALDGILSVEDVEYFSWVDAYPPICSCGMATMSAIGVFNATPAGRPCGSVPEAPLLIAGKIYRCDAYNAEHHFSSDGIFGYDSDRRATGEPFRRDVDRLNTRLVTDPDGTLHQLNVRDGLIKLPTDEPVLRWGRLGFESRQVDVGWIEQYHSEAYPTPPIQDAVFDSSGYLYVVPVSLGPGQRAAARIRLGANPDTGQVVQLYGESDLHPTGTYEIGLGPQEDVYVLDKRNWGNAVLRRYDRDSGHQTRSLELSQVITGFPAAPTAFHVSPADGQIIIANLTSLVFLRPSDFARIKDVEVSGVGQIVDIAEDAAGAFWVLGSATEGSVAGRDLRSGACMQYPPQFKAFLAKVPRNSGDSVTATCVSEYPEDGTEHLSFPISIVCTK